MFQRRARGRGDVLAEVFDGAEEAQALRQRLADGIENTLQKTRLARDQRGVRLLARQDRQMFADILDGVVMLFGVDLERDAFLRSPKPDDVVSGPDVDDFAVRQRVRRQLLQIGAGFLAGPGA